MKLLGYSLPGLVAEPGPVCYNSRCPAGSGPLGDRLMVGRETLDLVVEVQVLLPQHVAPLV